MKRWIMVLILVAFLGIAYSTVNADSPPGPAPNSGDGIPDGPSDGPWPQPPGPSGPNGK